MEINTEITVAKPLPEVFNYWADLERANEWAAPVIERRKITEGEIGVGTRYQAVDQFPGRQVEFIVEITAYEQNKLMAASWSEPMKGGWDVKFTQMPKGTKLTIHAEMNPTGILKLLSPIMNIWAKRAMQKDLTSFKERLEKE